MHKSLYKAWGFLTNFQIRKLLNCSIAFSKQCKESQAIRIYPGFTDRNAQCYGHNIMALPGAGDLSLMVAFPIGREQLMVAPVDVVAVLVQDNIPGYSVLTHNILTNGKVYRSTYYLILAWGRSHPCVCVSIGAMHLEQLITKGQAQPSFIILLSAHLPFIFSISLQRNLDSYTHLPAL